MKVYATVNSKYDNRVILKEWDSIKSFESSEKWCDPKFINVAKTNDLESYEFLPSQGGGFRIVYTPDQENSMILLHKKFIALRARKIKNV